MAILRQNEGDEKPADKAAEKAADKKDDKKAATSEPTASRRLATAQARSASGTNDEYDFTKPHSGDPKFLGGTVAVITKDGKEVLTDHLDEGDMLRSAHEDGKKYEARSTDL